MAGSKYKTIKIVMIWENERLIDVSNKNVLDKFHNNYKSKESKYVDLLF